MTGKHGETVKAAILAEGLALWRVNPDNVSARRIGKALHMTHANILYHFGSAAQLKHSLAVEAVRIGDRKIVPMLIASGHAAVAKMTAADKARYLAGC